MLTHHTIGSSLMVRHDGDRVRPRHIQPLHLPAMYIKDEPPPVINPGLTISDMVVDDVRRWRVAHTKSRAEKAFAWMMLRQGIGYFLPMFQPEVRISDRKRRLIQKPAFASYVFFCGDDDVRYAALATNYLCQVIEVVNQPVLVRELKNLEIAVNDGMVFDPRPELTEGKRCRVKAGHSLEGAEGFLETKSNRGFVMLRVTILGNSTPLEISPEFLEVVD
jgi:hypothetical protein